LLSCERKDQIFAQKLRTGSKNFGKRQMNNPQTTPELSNRNWKVIETCLILRKKELQSRKGGDNDHHVREIELVLGKINGN
jgi:hypothetical protein